MFIENSRSLLPAGVLLLAFLSICAIMPIQAQPYPGEVMVMDKPDFVPEAFQLSNQLKETSGLIHFDNGFWTFNDSGGKPEVYKVRSSDGRIIRTVVLDNANNVDWEDISQDDEHIYIGDFGNNWGNRKDLLIYKIRKRSIMAGEKVTIEAEIINFSYKDQHSFQNKNRSNNYDCESLICYNDHLILFSKNWVNGKTRMYKIPKNPGKYTAEPVAEFDVKGLVTGADYNPRNNELVLIGYTDRVPFIYHFYRFNGDDFNAGFTSRINFPAMVNIQTEGICLMEEKRLAISAEKTKQYKQAVYIIKSGGILGKAEVEKKK